MLELLVGVTRAKFLTLTLVCIALATAASWQSGASVSPVIVLLVLLMGLSAHISANAFNEYFDFHSGLDFLTQRTPFSGGSGALVARPEAHGLALWIALLSLIVVMLLGLYLAWLRDWRLLWIGVPGIVLIYAYTRYINRSPVLCLLAPGVGFGLMMTLGAFWAIAGVINAGAVMLALMVSLLVSNLLLLNQFPDVEADRQVQRCHFPIVLGRRRSALMYTVILGLSYACLLLGVTLQWLPPQALLALLSLLLVPGLIRGIFRHAEDTEQLIPYLGQNVLLCHGVPLFVLIGLIWAGP